MISYSDTSNPTSDDGSTALRPRVEPATEEKIPPPSGPKRAGYTTNKGNPRNKARARMAKVSRARNRRG